MKQFQANPPGCGLIFNIQRYSLHDGPGIRTIVFLKGCPLTCTWCSNPESQTPYPELGLHRHKCIGTSACDACLQACPAGAIHQAPDGKIALQRDLCQSCFRCVAACPAQAFRALGRLMSVDEVLTAVEEDSLFYARSGGGLTLSGGEPLAQADFARQLLTEAKRRHLNTAMETSGLASWDNLAQCCERLDTILYDIKCIDPPKHCQYTGVLNETILANFMKICETFPGLRKIVRTPVIPGFNDSPAEIGKIMAFLQGRPKVEYELAAYHRLGQSKYESLGREYLPGDTQLAAAKFQALLELVRQQRGSKAGEQQCSGL